MRDFDDGSQAELLDTGVCAYVCVGACVHCSKTDKSEYQCKKIVSK